MSQHQFGMDTGKRIIRAYVLKCDRERAEVGITKSLVSLWDRIQSKAVIDPDYAAACQRSFERELSGHPLPRD